MTLDEARAELLPGLWVWAQENGFQADIELAHKVDALIVVAWRLLDQPLAFCISRTRILDNLHRAEFAPSLEALAECLNAQKDAA